MQQGSQQQQTSDPTPVLHAQVIQSGAGTSNGSGNTSSTNSSSNSSSNIVTSNAGGNLSNGSQLIRKTPIIHHSTGSSNAGSALTSVVQQTGGKWFSVTSGIN